MKLFRKKTKGSTEHSKWPFWFSACSLFACASLYAYFVNAATFNAVRWSEVEEKIAAISGSVSELETAYLRLKQGVTLSLAYQRGFEDARGVKFIAVKKLGAVVRNSEL